MLKYALLFGLITNILALASPLYSMQVLDRVLSSGNINTLLMLSIVIATILLLLSFIQVSRSFAMNRMGIWLEKELSEKVFKNTIISTLDNSKTAGSQQLRDLQTIKSFLISPSLITILDVPWAVIFLIVLFALHTWIGLLTLIGGGLLISIGFFSHKITEQSLKKTNELFIQSMRYVDQASRNAAAVEVMAMMPNILNSWQKINKKVQKSQSYNSEKQTIFNEIARFIRTGLQLAITGLGAVLVIKGEFSSGAIIASSSLAGRALAPFENAISSWKSYISFHEAYKRLESSFSRKINENQMSLPEPNGYITLDNISWKPEHSPKNIITNIKLEIKPGEILVILGQSASGKSTLAQLIVGILQPNSGTVRIDGAKIQDWNRYELGRYIGYLPQNIELFTGTIRENIARMDEKGDAKAIIEAASLAGIHEMILKLPMGYDTEIGEGKATLSGGQKQRVALARAFYNNPKILVLDEPNANLDKDGEEALATALGIAKTRNISTVLISHRHAVTKIADKIVLIHNGEIALYGEREEVMRAINIC